MSLLRTLEDRLSSLVEGTFGRVFRSQVQPAEIARRLVREMDAGTRQSVRTIWAPNRFEVWLSPDDRAQFDGVETALRNELGEYLSVHARQQGYSLPSRPRVELMVDPALSLGAFGIAATIVMDDAAGAGAANAPLTPLAPPAGGGAPSSTSVMPAPVPATPISAPAPPVRPQIGVLEGAGMRAELRAERVTVGRGSANTIVLSDGSVSREHAALERTPSGTWQVVDLDSTNGVLHNGSRTSAAHLATGDLVTFGSVRMTFSLVDDPSAPALADAERHRD